MQFDGTIYYVCPDSSIPSGGFRRLYRHVEVLNKHGLQACILHESSGFSAKWFTTCAPIRYRGDPKFSLRPTDILVIPEVMTALMRDSLEYNIRRVVIALNWSFIFASLPLGEDWRTYGIWHAIAGSDYERQFILNTMGIRAVVTTAGIDCSSFIAREKKLQIVYMPTIRSVATNVLGAFRAMYPQYSSVKAIAIENRSHSYVAELLGESAIFLTATFPVGIGRPTLEAMAAECLVVGYNGRGADEYMVHDTNSLLAPDGDILGAARLLGRAVTLSVHAQSAQIQAEGRLTALKYDLHCEEASVLAFWLDYLSA